MVAAAVHAGAAVGLRFHRPVEVGPGSGYAANFNAISPSVFVGASAADYLSVDGGATESDAGSPSKRRPVRRSRFTRSVVDDVVVGVVITGTLLMWITFHELKPVFGNIGIVGLIPIVIFGGCGYFDVVDFNRLSWDVLILMGGGLSLGTIVSSSGLLHVVGDAMGELLREQPVFVVLLAFSSLVAVLANFSSSTVAAVLLLPVVAEVGDAVGHPRMLVLLCALMTSGAMGLPVSSFPNANSFGQRDVYGAPILTNSHYVRAGFPVCALVLLLINSLGYGLCLALKY